MQNYVKERGGREREREREKLFCKINFEGRMSQKLTETETPQMKPQNESHKTLCFCNSKTSKQNT